jgi:hypothetical protein
MRRTAPLSQLAACAVGFLLLVVFVKEETRAQHLEHGFFEQLELDFEVQTQLFYSRMFSDSLERAGILERTARTLVKVPTEDLAEDCLLRYLAESVTKQWIDSVLTVKRAETWLGSDCRQRFLEASLYDQVAYHHDGFVREVALEFKELARMHGVSVATVWFLTEFTQIAAITVLTAYGLGQYALLAPFIPLSFINTGIAIQIKSIRHHHRMRKGYGGRSVKKEAARIEQSLQYGLNLNYRNTIISTLEPVMGDTITLIAIQDPSWLSVLFRGGKRNPSRMYLGKLKHFLRKNGVSNPHYERLCSDKALTKRMRTVLALRYMHDQDALLFDDFASLNEGVFSEVPTDVYLSACADAEVKQWVFFLLKRNAPEELRDGLARIPDQLAVGEVIDLLENLVYPYWARNMKKSDFRAFRRMVKGTRSFRYGALLEQNQPWSFGYTERLLAACHMYDLEAAQAP